MRLLIIFLIELTVVISSCNSDCENSNPVCNQTAPNDEDCQAYFQRWFYEKKSNSCKQIGYSACNLYGFETKQECEICKCN